MKANSSTRDPVARFDLERLVVRLARRLPLLHLDERVTQAAIRDRSAFLAPAGFGERDGLPVRRQRFLATPGLRQQEAAFVVRFRPVRRDGDGAVERTQDFGGIALEFDEGEGLRVEGHRTGHVHQVDGRAVGVLGEVAVVLGFFRDGDRAHAGALQRFAEFRDRREQGKGLGRVPVVLHRAHRRVEIRAVLRADARLVDRRLPWRDEHFLLRMRKA